MWSVKLHELCQRDSPSHCCSDRRGTDGQWMEGPCMFRQRNLSTVTKKKPWRDTKDPTSNLSLPPSHSCAMKILSWTHSVWTWRSSWRWLDDLVTAAYLKVSTNKVHLWSLYVWCRWCRFSYPGQIYLKTAWIWLLNACHHCQCQRLSQGLCGKKSCSPHWTCSTWRRPAWLPTFADTLSYQYTKHQQRLVYCINVVHQCSQFCVSHQYQHHNQHNGECASWACWPTCPWCFDCSLCFSSGCLWRRRWAWRDQGPSPMTVEDCVSRLSSGVTDGFLLHTRRKNTPQRKPHTVCHNIPEAPRRHTGQCSNICHLSSVCSICFATIESIRPFAMPCSSCSQVVIGWTTTR